jgi:hypothetical protein
MDRALESPVSSALADHEVLTAEAAVHDGRAAAVGLLSPIR